MTTRSAQTTNASDDAFDHDVDGANDEPAAPKSFHHAADFYRADPVDDPRIHVIGVGNVGTFIAHSLRGLVNAPPVSLIFTRYARMQEWEHSPKRLTVVTDGDAEIQNGFDAEIAIPRVRLHGEQVDLEHVDGNVLWGESTEPINSLILCIKAYHALSTLAAVKHRLHKHSVILFMQNGMGVVEEVNRDIFPDPATRPHYMLGINSHGLHNTPEDNFTTVHAGFGTISLGLLPHERDSEPDAPYLPRTRLKATEDAPLPELPEELNPEYPAPTAATFHWTPNQRYLLRTLLRAPALAAAGFSPPDLLQMQLDKLAVNCVINPLTVMLDARNGAILNNYALTRVTRLLLSEISLVIRSLPELQYIPNIEQRFDPGKLETIVVSVAYKTRDNFSSMLADVRGGQRTEVEYINGWIIKRGQELGITCLTNYMLMQLVLGKRQVINLELGEGVPIVEDARTLRESDVLVGKGLVEKVEEE